MRSFWLGRLKIGGQIWRPMAPHVLGDLRVLDGALGVLVMEPAHDGRPVIGRLHDRAEQQRPLLILQHWAFTHGRSHLDDRLAFHESLVNPLLSQLIHPPEVDLEVVVKRRWHRSNGPLNQFTKFCSIHTFSLVLKLGRLYHANALT